MRSPLGRPTNVSLAARETVRRLFETEAVPNMHRWAQQHSGRALGSAAGDLGLLCIRTPEEYGGGGGSIAHDLILLETPTASMDKHWVTETAGQITDRRLQLFGGYVCMAEFPIARLYADSRAQRIWGGTNEIMK